MPQRAAQKSAALACSAALVIAAEGKQLLIQSAAVGLQVLRQLCRHIAQLVLLPGGIRNGQAVALLILADLRGYAHPLGKKAEQLRVDFVHATAQCL